MDSEPDIAPCCVNTVNTAGGRTDHGSPETACLSYVLHVVSECVVCVVFFKCLVGEVVLKVVFQKIPLVSWNQGGQRSGGPR